MNTRCDFDRVMIDSWNEFYSIIKKLEFRVYVEFGWKTFKERTFQVAGTAHIDNLEKLENALCILRYRTENFETHSYKGIYLTTSGDFRGLIISPKKNFLSLKQDFTELEKYFGKKIHGNSGFDCHSEEMLMKQMGNLIYEMLGITADDFAELQNTQYCFSSGKVLKWCDMYAKIRDMEMIKSEVNDEIGKVIDMNNRCNFNPDRVNIWNEFYSTVKNLDFRVYVEFDWKTFNDRKITAIGCIHPDNLEILKERLGSLCNVTICIATKHYRGFYFECSTDFTGLFIAPKKETDTWKHNFEELALFGKINGIENLVSIDGSSLSLLLKNMEYLLYDMAGFYKEDLFAMKSEGCSFKPNDVSFWCDIYTIVKKFDFKVQMDFNWQTFNKRKFNVIGALKGEKLDSLKERFIEMKFKMTDLSGSCFKGIYFEHSPGLFGVFLSPDAKLISLGQNTINSDLDFIIMLELHAYAREHNLEILMQFDFWSSTLANKCISRVIADELGITEHNVGLKAYYNSHREYVRNYLERREAGTGKSLTKYSIEEKHYENIEMFSRLYFIEIMILARLFKKNKISIHDVGTNVAQFPLLLSSLTKEEAAGLDIFEIIASDIGWTGEEFIEEIRKENPTYKPINFMKLDLIKDIEAAPVTDVIIANDVL